MTYDAVKNNLVTLMEQLSYHESTEPFEFEDASSQTLDLAFIVAAVEGTLDPEGETLIDRIYDDQQWEIKVAFKKSGHNDVINRDQMNRKRVLIIQKLDNPSSWASIVRIQKYQSWKVEEFPNYFLLTVTVQIIDRVTY